MPRRLRCILDGFSDCFRAPTFNAFSALVVGDLSVRSVGSKQLPCEQSSLRAA